MCQVSLSGRCEFTRGQAWFWAPGWDWMIWQLHHRLCTVLRTYCQNKHHRFHFRVFKLWHFILGFVNVDSVWSAAHSQSSTIQYPFLVQPESCGTPQSCPTAEPCPPLSGNVLVVPPWKTQMYFPYISTVYLWTYLVLLSTSYTYNVFTQTQRENVSSNVWNQF